MDGREYIRKRMPGVKEEDITAAINQLFGAYFVPDDVLAGECRLLEKVLSPQNLASALQKVVSNGGAPGIDGMRVEELQQKYREQKPRVLRTLYSGDYVPSPVLRKQIPKPDGGSRNLGIPTAVDRLVQQAIFQVLYKIYDKTFSEHSYGFRQGRSAKDGVMQVVNLANKGYRYATAIDIEKFFDRVNHKVLTSLLERTIKEEKLLNYIDRYLNAGVVINRKLHPTTEGVPQGGPLSPLFANVVLNELDVYLTKENITFVRYADDVILLSTSQTEAEQAYSKARSFIEQSLKLRVNETKTQKGRLENMNFLGFTFKMKNDETIISVPLSALARLREKMCEIDKKFSGEEAVEQKRMLIRGWTEYYDIGLDFETGLPK